jgi:hypothetical protein
MSEESTYSKEQAHNDFARGLNGQVWGLLGKEDRTAEDDELMVHAAHASLYHWLQIGTPLHHQRGQWLISHVYAELGLAEAALRHAERCHELTEANLELMEDFDLAYRYEALARAHAVAGNTDEADRYKRLALEAGEKIADKESKSYFDGDFKGGNWG